MDQQSQESKKRVSHKRRLVMVVVAVGLGVVCRFVPENFQVPCAVVARGLAWFMGVPQ